MRHLLDIMPQAEQLPLRVYFLLAPQCEPIHSLVLQIPEHWFHNRYPLVIDEPAEERVELPLHPFDRGVLLLFHTANKDGHLLGLGGLGCFKTTLSQRTRPAERLARAEADPDKPLDVNIFAVAVKHVSRRTTTGIVLLIMEEVFNGEAIGAGPCVTTSLVFASALLVAIIVRKRRIALPIATVGHVSIDGLLFNVADRSVTVI